MNTTLLVNGRIYTPDAPDATALAITGDQITWVGQDGPGRATHPDARVIDLAGTFVAPAFVDAHVHATATGLLRTGIDLTNCTSLADCLATVRAHTATVTPEGVLWGHGWDETRWPEQRPPTRAELDTAAGGVPVYLSRIDAHSALVSTALLALAPQARGAAGWSDTGPVSRDAHHHTRGAAFDAIPGAQRHEAQRVFLRHAASRGIAAVHECAGPDISSLTDLADLLTLGTAERLPDVVGYWGQAGALDAATAAGARGLAGDLFVDGALGSRTAALTQPYRDDPTNTGATYLTAAQITDHVITCTRAGVQAGFHAIGDAAVTAVVDGFTAAERVVGGPALAARAHRVEHLEMVTAAQAQQLARWGVIASVQPAFDAAWGGPDGMYARRLGNPRGTGLNPYAQLAKTGLTLAFGSDTPVTPLDPWGTLRAAVHHRTEGAGISPRAAFTAHTRAGWRAAGARDSHAGVLTPGAPATYAIWQAADLVVTTPDSRVQRWSTDPRAGVPGLPPLDPDQTLPTCVATVLRGHTIHDPEGVLG
ncbi:MAG TPA: amidohydrolase [Sporichthyaceae bacterium]|nr:amidohydrolase [Sporichthyaceae bacterium]